MSKRRFVSLIVFLVLVCFQGQGTGQCEPTTDCNGNGVLDNCDLLLGSSDDCNDNLIPDECEIADLSSQDCNLNGIPDECEPVVPSQLINPNGSFGEEFGIAAGMTDGITVVGAPGDDALGNNAGAVHVFRRVGTSWVDEIKLTASDPVPNDQFGAAVAVNSDLVVVGAPDKANQTGAVYVFRRIGSNWWNLEAKLTAFDGVSGFLYGAAVGTSNGRVYVGAPMAGTISGSGAVYIYHNAGGAWLLEAKITSGAALPGDEFGGAISSRDDLIAVGAPGTAVNQIARAGKAIIYQGLSGQWFQQGFLSPSNPQQNGRYGTSLAIGPGSLLIGAPGEDGDQGAAYIYDQGGSSWTLDQRLTSQLPDGNDTFGISVALGSGTAAIGAPGANGGDGRIFTYRYVDGQWASNAILEPMNPIAGDDSFGSSVAASGVFAMFGSSGAQTAYAHWIGTPADCNANFVEDVCDITSGTSPDCNLNQIPDECEIANGSQSDCNLNGIPDECEIAAGNLEDCNLNNVPDACDLSTGTSFDCNLNGNPDDCEVDCNNNGVPDDCDLQSGLASDCNGNLIPDSCDLSLEFSNDCNLNSIPDECDLSSSSSLDCNLNGTPDECDISQGSSVDCNTNGIPDNCDLVAASSLDCNINGAPDECDIATGISFDCDSDLNPDECELISGSGFDCNLNGVLDNCDIAVANSNDCNLNSIPDDCEVDVDTNPPVINNIPAVITLGNDLNACGAVVNWDEPVVSDNCGISTFSPSHNSGSFFGVGTTTVQYTATDVSGNQSSADFQIIIVDDELPTLTGVSGDIMVNATLDECGTLVSWLAPFPNDNCEVISMTSSANPGDSFSVGNTVVTYTVNDSNGNESSASFNVTVIDNQSPELTGVPGAITVSSEAGLCSSLVNWAEPVANDNCQVFLFVSDFASGSSFPVGQTTVTYSVSDLSGNSASQSFLVIVEDLEAPEFTNFPVGVNLGTDSGICEGTAIWEIPTITDNCGIASATSSHVPGQVFALGSTTVSYSATDVNGNVTSQSFEVLISDQEAPVLVGVPGTITLEAEPGLCTGIATWIEPTATDNCTLQSITGNHIPSAIFPVGETEVSYTANDEAGNSSTTSFLVTVVDAELPQITGMPGNISFSSDPGDCGAIVTWLEPDANDNCSVSSLSSSIPSGTVLSVGSHNVVYTATDVSGNFATSSFIVTVIDEEIPLIVGDLSDISSGTDPDSCHAIVNWIEPTALDNCSIQSLTSDIPSGAAFITGTTTVTYSATDINGNTSNHQFAVTVMDVQNPEIMGMPASISLSSESGSCEATASWLQPTTGDNCSVLSFSGSHVSGTSFPVGTTSVAYTAVDTSGNTTVETFTVTVADLEGPSIVNLPADINLANDQGLCGAIVSWIEPTTADNCGSASMTSSHQPGSFFPVGETEVQYVSVDAEGNSFASSFNVLVVDQELPEITGIPTDITIFADPGQCSGIHTWIDPVATDNCTVSTLEVTQGPGSAFLVGTTSVIYTVIDQAGHSVTSSFVVTVLDDQAPEILGTPSDILVTAEVGQCTAPATWIPANATDNCSIETFISSHNSGDVFPLGSNVVTYSATDASGNSSDTTFVVQVIDDQAPEITGMPAAFSISADQGECGAIVSWIAPVSSDNCGLNDLSSDIANGSFLAVGITTVTYTAVDPTGNSTSMSFVVEVLDDEPPVISSLPNDLVLQTETGLCGAPATWIDAQSADNCGISSFGADIQNGSFFDLGMTTVQYLATDIHGNQSVASFTITVVDAELPAIIGLPGDISVVSDPGFCTALVTWIEPVSADNCGTSTIEADIPSGSNFAVGTTPVTYTATDTSGNIQTGQFNVVVADLEAPEISSIPGNILVETDLNSCSAAVTWQEPVANDNCDLATLSSSHLAGSGFDLGITQVSYTAVDQAGNESVVSFLVEVSDTQAPEITGLPVDFSVSTLQGQCGATVTWVPPVGNDNCQVQNLASNIPSGAFLQLGVTEITYTAIDQSGNQISTSFNVDVIDTEAPVLIDMPLDITVNNDPGFCTAVVDWTNPTSLDNCGASVVGSNIVPGTTFTLGTTEVVCVATDDAGNSTNATFTVTVQDGEAPQFIDTPTDVFIENDLNQCGALASWLPATAGDNCQMGAIISSHDIGSFFPQGDTVVTYTATDGAGNEQSTAFTVHVADSQLPALVNVPADFSIIADAGECGALVSWTEPVAVDNCQISSLTSNLVSGAFLPVGAAEVIYTAVDTSGNELSEGFTVTVLDLEAPLLMGLPADLTGVANTGQCNTVVSWVEPTSSDNCSLQSLVSTHLPGSTFEVGATDVSYTATDINGNQTIQFFTITITDIESPLIFGVPAAMELMNDPGQCGAIAIWTEPTAADNCTLSFLESSISSGTFIPVGTSSVVYTASDLSGNTSQQSFTVTVLDNEFPVITGMPEDLTLSNDLGVCGASGNWIDPVAEDNCMLLSFGSNYQQGSVFPIGTTLVTYTATDNAGHSSTATFNVTVTDEEAPTIFSLPGDIVVPSDLGECGAMVSWQSPLTSDNCQVVDFGTPAVNGGFYPVGVTGVTYTATDQVGNIGTASFNIIVEDHEAPAIIGLPIVVTVAAEIGTCQAMATWEQPSAIDNCAVDTLVSDLASGTIFSIGQTSVTYSATDIHGNSTTASFLVEVQDSEAPLAIGIPEDITVLADAGGCSTVVSWAEPTVSDNCSATGITSDIANGSFFSVGTTLVTYTSEDLAGNTSTASFNVTVIDDQIPEILNLPLSIVVELPDQACEAFVSWIPAEATDNCGVQNLISNHASGSAFPVGGTTVLYTATDLSGNESYGMFQVTVLDTTSPIIGGLPQPIITQTDQGQCGASVMWVEPTVFDNCTVVTFESSHLPGSIIPVGTTTVSYTASDAGGNTTTASFSITVSDSENPVVVPSGAITVDADPGSCTAFVAVPPPASTDNCSVASLVNDFNGTSEASGIFPMDTTVILWIVTDSYGNVGTAAQAITVSVPQIDCNLNGSPDTCDIASGTSLDCNVDGIPDECQEDCNGNGVPDDCDIAAGALPDCNGNGIPDSCDITSGMAQDCDLSGVPDTCEVTSGQLPDCNANGTPDTCEIGSGVASDCNGNGIPDACDLSSGTSTDCNLNSIPDICDLASGFAPDCNVNGVPDSCDFISGSAIDCNGNLLPDSCEIAAGSQADCNGNGYLDSCEVQQGLVEDCNSNLIPDTCDLSAGSSPDCNSNLIPDECDIATGQVADCNTNGIPDNCDLVNGTVSDCDSSGIPDQCEVASGQASDCNSNGIPDTCDIASGVSVDCNLTGIPDSCELAMGQVPDCDGNSVPDSCDLANGTVSDCDSSGIPDSCEVASGQVSDCNSNGIPDNCDLASGTVSDCDSSGIPDTCEVASGQVPDCNLNGVPDSCDLASGTDPDCDSSGIPDSCEVASGQTPDCDGNGTPDACDIATGQVPDCDLSGVPDSCEVTSGQTPDCNGNGIPDSCEISSGNVADCDSSGIPDSCEVSSGQTADCNTNGIPDSCDIATGVEADCNDTGIPDACEVLNGIVPDCNSNSVPDSCDIAGGIAIDCDNDGLPDSCEVAQGSESDCNADGVPDLCQIASGALEDCNGNQVPDSCDVATGTSEDLNTDGLPDECQVQFRRGDANGDSIVNIADGIYLLQNLFGGGPAPACQDSADANDDGGIDVSDVIFVLGFQFGGGAAPPAPFEECGVDPTDLDGMSCQTYGACQ